MNKLYIVHQLVGCTVPAHQIISYTSHCERFMARRLQEHLCGTVKIKHVRES